MSVASFIREGEHQQQDFKFRIDDQKKIARTLAAFANTEGGRLLIGVKDNGKIAGCTPEEEFHMIEGAAQVYCEPALEFKSIVHQEGFRLVLEIQVEKAAKRNITAPNENGKVRAYFRLNDRTIEVSKILRKVWMHEDKLTKRPNVFDETDREFLKFFSDDAISLSKLYRVSKWKKNKVDELLPKFIFWGLVKVNYEESRMSFSLPEVI
jgi:predicted HTH transcriptional regulator